MAPVAGRLAADGGSGLVEAGEGGFAGALGAGAEGFAPPVPGRFAPICGSGRENVLIAGFAGVFGDGPDGFAAAAAGRAGTGCGTGRAGAAAAGFAGVPGGRTAGFAAPFPGRTVLCGGGGLAGAEAAGFVGALGVVLSRVASSAGASVGFAAARAGFWYLRALRRPRHSGRWLHTHTVPALMLSCSIVASQAGHCGGVNCTLLINFGAHCDTASKSSSGCSRAAVISSSSVRALMSVIDLDFAKFRASHV